MSLDILRMKFKNKFIVGVECASDEEIKESIAYTIERGSCKLNISYNDKYVIKDDILYLFYIDQDIDLYESTIESSIDVVDWIEMIYYDTFPNMYELNW